MAANMSDIVQKKNREEAFKNYIQEILRNRGIDCDEIWWADQDAQKELTELAGARENYITDSRQMNIGGSETLIFAVYQKKDDTFVDTVGERISSLSYQFRLKASDIQLVFFVEDMKSRIFLEKTFPRDIVCVLIRKYGRQEVKLKDLNRFDMMQEPPVCGKINLEKGSDMSCTESGRTIRGLVCTANLFQIVELYNLFGDQLFKYNVRIGIKETLNVDSAIRNTLDTEPECFWFKNNGITILVENPDFKINQAEELTLDQMEEGRELRFSVVNGAQTINTAAQYFYGLDYQLEKCSDSKKEEIQNKLNQSKKARVLLRVIHIPVTEDAEQPSYMAKEISVALNRQKPIKIEDIAFTARFVEKLIRYLEEKKVVKDGVFKLVRRGEKTDEYRQMDLVEFARARLACAGYPGDARSQSANELLKFRAGEDGQLFANRIIFADDWMDADDSDQYSIYQRDYKAVWYAHQIALEYEKISRGLKNSAQDKQNIINNGKWYFTAFLIQMVNGYKQWEPEWLSGKPDVEKLPDFTAFTCDLTNILNPMREAVERFAEIVVTYIETSKEREKYGELDSNLFKKNDLYRDIMQELEDGVIYARQKVSQLPLLEQCQKFAALFSLELFPKEPLADFGKVSEWRDGWPDKYVILDYNLYPVESDAEALEKIVAYILTNYHPIGYWLEATDGWLTDDEMVSQKGQKYFRGAPRQIYVNGKKYWLGTASNTQTKRRQIQQLCELAGVPEGSISWYKGSQKTPVFLW